MKLNICVLPDRNKIFIPRTIVIFFSIFLNLKIFEKSIGTNIQAFRVLPLKYIKNPCFGKIHVCNLKKQIINIQKN